MLRPSPIQYRREQLSLTIQKMAEKTGLSEKTIEAVESMRHAHVNPAITALIQDALDRERASHQEKFDAEHARLMATGISISIQHKRSSPGGAWWACELSTRTEEGDVGASATGHGHTPYIAIRNASLQAESVWLSIQSATGRPADLVEP